MKPTAPRGRLAIAPPAPQVGDSLVPSALVPSAEDATKIIRAVRRERSDGSGEFSRATQSEDRQTLPELEPAHVPVIDLDDLSNERAKDTIPAPTWLGDD